MASFFNSIPGLPLHIGLFIFLQSLLLCLLELPSYLIAATALTWYVSRGFVLSVVLLKIGQALLPPQPSA